MAQIEFNVTIGSVVTPPSGDFRDDMAMLGPLSTNDNHDSSLFHDSSVSPGDYTFYRNGSEVTGSPSLGLDDTIYAERVDGETAYRTNTQTVVAPSMPHATSVTPISKMASDNASLTLSGAAQWGYYAGSNVDVWVFLNGGSITVTDDFPSSTVVTTSGPDSSSADRIEDQNGDYVADGVSVEIHGMHENLLMWGDMPNSTSVQGVEGMFSYHNRSFKTGFTRLYSSSSNISPSKSGNGSIVVSSEKTLTKRVKVKATSQSPTNNSGIDVHFHFVDVIPPAGSLSPGSYNATTKRPLVSVGMMNKNALGAGRAVPSGGTSLATAKSNNYMDESIPFWASFGESMRGATLNVNTSDGYTGTTGGTARYRCGYLEGMIYEGSSISDEDAAFGAREGMHLLHLAAYTESDTVARNGAGQSVGFCGQARVAYHLFENAFLRRQADRVIGTWGMQVNGWTTAANVGAPVISTGSDVNNHFSETIQTGHIGLPLWTQEGDERANMDAGARYRIAGGAASLLEFAVIGNLRGGPDDLDGLSTYTRQDEVAGWGDANPNADMVGYLDLYASFNLAAEVGSVDYYTSALITLYNTTRDDWTPPRWEGPAFSVTPAQNWGEFFSAGSSDGEVDWDLTNIGGDTATVTAWQVQLSIDGYHYFDVDTQGVSGTQDGLPNDATVFMRYRRFAAGQWSAWSVNFDRYDGLRMFVTAPGVATGTPVNTVAPQVLAPEYHNWPGRFRQGGLYIDAATAYAADGANTDFFLGVGLWTGDITGGFSFKWEDDGVDIPGEILNQYQRGDASAYVLTGTVSVGGESETATGVSLNAVVADPAFVFKTEFDGLFPLMYPAIAASLTGNALHQPNQRFDTLGLVNGGALKANRGNPGNAGGAVIPVTDGQNYNIKGKLVVNEPDAILGDNGQLRLGPTDFSVDYGVPLVASDAGPTVLDIDINFTATSDELHAVMYYGGAPGGSGGSDMYWASAELTEVA